MTYYRQRDGPVSQHHWAGAHTNNNNNREHTEFSETQSALPLNKHTNRMMRKTHDYTNQRYTNEQMKHTKINIFIQSMAKNAHTRSRTHLYIRMPGVSNIRKLITVRFETENICVCTSLMTLIDMTTTLCTRHFHSHSHTFP